MSDKSQEPVSAEKQGQRCPQCDTLNPAGAVQCVSCAAALTSATMQDTPLGRAGRRLRADRLLPLKLVVAAVCLIGLILAAQTWLNPDPIAAVLYPTATPTPATPTRTPTPFPTPTATPAPATEAAIVAPTDTPTPQPTATPQPPRVHEVTSGETLVSIALFYGLTLESLLEANSIDPSTLQAGQTIAVPWPTPTPPLTPVEVEINGLLFVADPTDCERHEVEDGDSLFGVSIRYNVDLEAILAANRLTEQTLIKPGDTICIPEVYETFALGEEEEDSAESTPPTPTPTGPRLLYPQQDALVTGNDPLVLQWLAEKTLASNEQYMVEVTNLTDVTSRPFRAFTRNTSLQLPDAWQPPEGDTHTYRWRVRIVAVVDERPDGDPIYTASGLASRDSLFDWRNVTEQ